MDDMDDISKRCVNERAHDMGADHLDQRRQTDKGTVPRAARLRAGFGSVPSRSSAWSWPTGWATSLGGFRRAIALIGRASHPIDAFVFEDLGLTVERQAVVVPRCYMGDEVRTWSPLKMGRLCRCLRDHLAGAAGVDRTNVTDDLELR